MIVLGIMASSFLVSCANNHTMPVKQSPRFSKVSIYEAKSFVREKDLLLILESDLCFMRSSANLTRMGYNSISNIVKLMDEIVTDESVIAISGYLNPGDKKLKSYNEYLALERSYKFKQALVKLGVKARFIYAKKFDPEYFKVIGSDKKDFMLVEVKN